MVPMREGFTMRLASKVLWVLALLAFPSTGCNPVHTPPETALLEISVAHGCEQLLEGVKVCVGDSGDCVLSGPNGEVTLELPVGEEIYYTLQKEGYDSQLIPYVMKKGGANTTGPWCLATVEQEADFKEIIGVPYPRSGTGDMLILFQPLKAGVTFDLKGATGTRYYDLSPFEDPYISFDLEATTDTGSGGFFEVRPGDTFRVELGGTADGCVPTFGGWPDAQNKNSVRFPIREDHYTILTVRCPVSLPQ